MLDRFQATNQRPADHTGCPGDQNSHRASLSALRRLVAPPPIFTVSLPCRLEVCYEPSVGDFRLYCRGPKTTRNTTLKSSSARAQSPVKLEPCMMASVFGFRSASFFKFPAVS